MAGCLNVWFCSSEQYNVFIYLYNYFNFTETTALVTLVLKRNSFGICDACFSVSHKFLTFIFSFCLQVIGLLDVFTPETSLEEFNDV